MQPHPHRWAHSSFCASTDAQVTKTSRPLVTGILPAHMFFSSKPPWPWPERQLPDSTVFAEIFSLFNPARHAAETCCIFLVTSSDWCLRACRMDFKILFSSRWLCMNNLENIFYFHFEGSSKISHGVPFMLLSLAVLWHRPGSDLFLLTFLMYSSFQDCVSNSQTSSINGTISWIHSNLLHTTFWLALSSNKPALKPVFQ